MFEDQRLKLQSTFKLNSSCSNIFSGFAKMGLSITKTLPNFLNIKNKTLTVIKRKNLSHNYFAGITWVTPKESLVSTGINDVILLKIKNKIALRHSNHPCRCSLWVKTASVTDCQISQFIEARNPLALRLLVLQREH